MCLDELSAVRLDNPAAGAIGTPHGHHGRIDPEFGDDGQSRSQHSGGVPPTARGRSDIEAHMSAISHLAREFVPDGDPAEIVIAIDPSQQGHDRQVRVEARARPRITPQPTEIFAERGGSLHVEVVEVGVAAFRPVLFDSCQIRGVNPDCGTTQFRRRF